MVNASEVSQDELARYYEALGPIRDLVLDDSLTEVMVNGHENVYVERNGKILLTDRKFDDENHLLRVIDFIVSAVGRRIDFRTPMVDARRSEEHTSELQSRGHLVCRLLLEK